MNRKTILFLLVTAVFSTNIYAQAETKSLSLEEAKNYALENNLLLKNAQLNVILSDKKIWEAISAGLPQADFSMEYIDYFNYELEFSFGGEQPDPYIPDITKLDPGDYEVLQFINSLFSQSSGSSAILMDNSASAKFQVSQLIFNGQYWVGIQTAKLARKMADQSLEKTQEDVKEMVSTAYYLVLVVEESIKILDKNLNNLNKSIEQSEALLIAGMIESYDIDQIKMSLTMLQNTRNSMMRNLELNYNLLRFQLGVEANTPIVLTESLESLLDETYIAGLLAAGFSHESNIDFKLMQMQEDLTSKMVEMEKTSYLPTIAAFYSYNEKIITTDFDINPKNIAGVSLSWSLFQSNMRNVKRQQAEINLDIMRNNKQMVADQLSLQEKQYRYNLKNTLDNYNVQKENLLLAENVYANIERKYNQGVISSMDLTQASSNYLQAQNTYISSILEVLQSKLALDKLLSKL